MKTIVKNNKHGEKVKSHKVKQFIQNINLFI